MSRIFIVGAGVVGTSTGRALLDAGHPVTFVDTDAARVTELVAQGLDARAVLDLADEPESTIVLTLPTPGIGHGYDLSALRRAAQHVAAALRDAGARHTVVVRSTVPPGTTDGMVRHVLERGSDRLAGDHFDLVACPHFGDDPALTVIGAARRVAAVRVADLFAPLGGTLHVAGSADEAEMIKVAHSLRQAAEVRFWAEITAVSTRVGVDAGAVAAVLRAGDAGDDYEAKDAEGLLGFATDRGVPMPLLAAVVATADRDRQAARPVPRVRLEADAILLDTRSVVASNGRY